MDYDGDGILDFLSGSYDPGDVYLFRGVGEGKFAAVELLEDRAGIPIVHHPKQLAKYHGMRGDAGADPDASIQARIASFGSWAFPVDWEDDGDLDLLIGSFSGKLYRRTNVGTRKHPIYHEDVAQVQAAGEPLSVVGHADPVAADWDGDGRWDLVVGSSTGEVLWYRNVGTATEPSFAAARTLVAAKSSNKFLTQTLHHGEEPRPGVRAQIDVTDFDGDGHLDLLVGDYSNVTRLREMSPAELELYEALVVERDAARAKRHELGEGAAGVSKLDARLEQIGKELNSFQDPHRRSGLTSHVWLYRRKP